METAGDKQAQKRGKDAGGEFHLWVINVDGDESKGRIQIFLVGPKRENKDRKIKKRFLKRCNDVRRSSEYSLKEG